MKRKKKGVLTVNPPHCFFRKHCLVPQGQIDRPTDRQMLSTRIILLYIYILCFCEIFSQCTVGYVFIVYNCRHHPRRTQSCWRTSRRPSSWCPLVGRPSPPWSSTSARLKWRKNREEVEKKGELWEAECKKEDRKVFMMGERKKESERKVKTKWYVEKEKRIKTEEKKNRKGRIPIQKKEKKRKAEEEYGKEMI